MADELSAMGRVLLQAKRVVHHWHAFGPEADFAREIEALDAALQQWRRVQREEESRG